MLDECFLESRHPFHVRKAFANRLLSIDMAKEHVSAVNGHTTEKDLPRNGANSENSDNAGAQELEHPRRNDVHAQEPAVYEYMSLRLFMCLVAMSFLWVGSQIPLYLYGSVLPDIYSEIGGATNGRWVWMVIGYLIPNAALCPFVGALSDLVGRKWVAAFGQVALVVGPVVVSTANEINVAICGMVIAGLGAGLNELIALAGTSELVPVRKRAVYVGGIVFTILPFCPSPLWAQLITKASNWRYNGYLIGGWNLVGLILVMFCYKEPPKPSRPAREILAEVDYVGGLLSTAGVVLLMMGLQWGSREVCLLALSFLT
jgi:MFS family permease